MPSRKSWSLRRTSFTTYPLYQYHIDSPEIVYTNHLETRAVGQQRGGTAVVPPNDNSALWLAVKGSASGGPALLLLLLLLESVRVVALADPHHVRAGLVPMLVGPEELVIPIKVVRGEGEALDKLDTAVGTMDSCVHG